MEEEIQLAEEAIERREFELASEHCRKALEHEPQNYEALVLSGRVASYAGDYATAEVNYRKAAIVEPGALSALEGLASVQIGTNKIHEGAVTYTQLVGLACTKSDIVKQREFLWRLAEAHDKMGKFEEAEEHLISLLAMPLETDDQRLEALCFLADVQQKKESLAQESRLNKYLKLQDQQRSSMKRTRSALRLQVDAERADEQSVESYSLAATLKQIVHRTLPDPKFSRYHESHLQVCLSRMGNYPPRSAARQEKRMEAMRECVRMITTSAGGCTTPFPFEAAIWLLEEQEELYGGTFPVQSGEKMRFDQQRRTSLEVQTKLNWFRGNSIHRMSTDKINIRKMVPEPALDEELEDTRPVVTKHESFGVKLSHQFPWLGSASVAIGLALRRRFLSDPDSPSTVVRRKQITAVSLQPQPPRPPPEGLTVRSSRVLQALKRGIDMGADSAAGRKALAELQYQNRQWAAAHESCSRGLEWSARRRQAGHETLAAFALALRLCSARCLRRLGRLPEAEYAFKILAGWTTDGECGFDELSGSPPTSIRQQAVRGLAKIALERGQRDEAKAHYERILGKAIMGRGQPAEHWAHAEYAWLQFQDGDLHTAKSHLEKALAVAAKEGCSVTDSEMAEHHYKLGRVLWDLGGAARTDPRQARAQFQAASLEDNDFQTAACVWLGHWYSQVAEDFEKAKTCYEEALLADPADAPVAEALKHVNERLGLVAAAGDAAVLAAAGRSQQASSAFESLSQKAFEDASAPEKEKMQKILSSIAERAPSGRIVLQAAHSANSELAGYWTVARKPSTK